MKLLEGRSWPGPCSEVIASPFDSERVASSSCHWEATGDLLAQGNHGNGAVSILRGTGKSTNGNPYTTRLAIQNVQVKLRSCQIKCFIFLPPYINLQNDLESQV